MEERKYSFRLQNIVKKYGISCALENVSLHVFEAAGASLDAALLYLQRICSFDGDAVCLAGKVSFASQ